MSKFAFLIVPFLLCIGCGNAGVVSYDPSTAHDAAPEASKHHLTETETVPDASTVVVMDAEVDAMVSGDDGSVAADSESPEAGDDASMESDAALVVEASAEASLSDDASDAEALQEAGEDASPFQPNGCLIGEELCVHTCEITICCGVGLYCAKDPSNPYGASCQPFKDSGGGGCHDDNRW